MENKMEFVINESTVFRCEKCNNPMKWRIDTETNEIIVEEYYGCSTDAYFQGINAEKEREYY